MYIRFANTIPVNPMNCREYIPYLQETNDIYCAFSYFE